MGDSGKDARLLGKLRRLLGKADEQTANDSVHGQKMANR